MVARRAGPSVARRATASVTPETAAGRTRPGLLDFSSVGPGSRPTLFGQLIGGHVCAACRSPKIARYPAEPFRRYQKRILSASPKLDPLGPVTVVPLASLIGRSGRG